MRQAKLFPYFVGKALGEIFFYVSVQTPTAIAEDAKSACPNK
jgi:hypothetical protein